MYNRNKQLLERTYWCTLYRFDTMIYAWHVKWQVAYSGIKVTTEHTTSHNHTEIAHIVPKSSAAAWKSKVSFKAPKRLLVELAKSEAPGKTRRQCRSNHSTSNSLEAGRISKGREDFFKKYIKTAKMASHCLRARCGMFDMSEDEWRSVKMSEVSSQRIWYKQSSAVISYWILRYRDEICHANIAETPFSKHSCKRLLEFEIQVCLEKLPHLTWRIASANRVQRVCCVCWGTYGDISVCQFRKIFWSSGIFGNRPTCALDLAKLCNLRLPDTLVPFLCLESCNRLLLTAIPGTFYHLFGFFAWLRKDPRRHHWDSKPQK